MNVQQEAPGLLAAGPVGEFLLANVFNELVVVHLVLAVLEVKVLLRRFQDFSTSVGLERSHVGVV